MAFVHKGEKVKGLLTYRQILISWRVYLPGCQTPPPITQLGRY